MLVEGVNMTPPCPLFAALRQIFAKRVRGEVPPVINLQPSWENFTPTGSGCDAMQITT